MWRSLRRPCRYVRRCSNSVLGSYLACSDSEVSCVVWTGEGSRGMASEEELEGGVVVAGAGVLLIEVNSLGCAVGACKFREPLLGALMTFRHYYSLPLEIFYVGH